MVRQLRGFRRRIPLGYTLMAALVVIAMMMVLFPIIWMFFTSIRPIRETLSHPPVWIPREITLEAYIRLLSAPRQIRFLRNTYFIATPTALLSIGLGSLAAYGFSRFRIRGGHVILLSILSLQMLPAVALIIPFFNMALWLDIHHTFLAVILADTGFALPISIWMLKGYMDSIPVDLEEAAMVDGCSRLQALYKIVLPLALPGLVGTATFAFLWAWNEFMFAVILAAGYPDVAPLTIAISEFITESGRAWSDIMALNVIATLPLMVLFIFLQRWVIQGMTAGAVK